MTSTLPGYPMETAPTDASLLLLMGGEWTTGRWDDDRFAQKPRPFWRRFNSRSVLWCRENQPTCWLPLPPVEGSAPDPRDAEIERIAAERDSLLTHLAAIRDLIGAWPPTKANHYGEAIGSPEAVVELVKSEIERLREALTDAVANLTAAASAYERHASRHRFAGRATADPFYRTRVRDFHAAAERGHIAVVQPVESGKDR